MTKVFKYVLLLSLTGLCSCASKIENQALVMAPSKVDEKPSSMIAAAAVETRALTTSKKIKEVEETTRNLGEVIKEFESNGIFEQRPESFQAITDAYTAVSYELVTAVELVEDLSVEASSAVDVARKKDAENKSRIERESVLENIILETIEEVESINKSNRELRQSNKKLKVYKRIVMAIAIIVVVLLLGKVAFFIAARNLRI